MEGMGYVCTVYLIGLNSKSYFPSMAYCVVKKYVSMVTKNINRYPYEFLNIADVLTDRHYTVTQHWVAGYKYRMVHILK